MFRFEQLKVWHKAVELYDVVDKCQVIRYSAMCQLIRDSHIGIAIPRCQYRLEAAGIIPGLASGYTNYSPSSELSIVSVFANV